jgi:hypothetical protein
MRPQLVTKYAFRIRTRAGLTLQQLMIPGRDLEDAERKLRQIYRDCEILACASQLDRDRDHRPVAAYLEMCQGMAP